MQQSLICLPAIAPWQLKRLEAEMNGRGRQYSAVRSVGRFRVLFCLFVADSSQLVAGGVAASTGKMIFVVLGMLTLDIVGAVSPPRLRDALRVAKHANDTIVQA